MQNNNQVWQIAIFLGRVLPVIALVGCAEATKLNTISPSDPNIQYWGRWDESDPAVRIANWGQVGFKMAFEGPRISILLTDEQRSLDELGGTGNYYQFSIDDGPFVVLPSTEETEYVLAEDLDDAAHTLFFIRRTESMYGRTEFRGVRLDEGKKLMAPPARPERRIEILGDSLSTGLANENTGSWANDDQNGYMAFGPQTARLLDAEWRVEARGGGSFYDQYWLPMRGFFKKTFGPFELQHNPDAANPDWDFSSWQPDVFILALGTNDFSEEYAPHIEEELYVAEYQGFLRELRALYPDAEIVCLAPVKEGAPWDEARAYIPIAVNGLGDSHIVAVVPRDGEQSWLTHPEDYVDNDEFHPNITGHTRIAEKLADFIRNRMGW